MENDPGYFTATLPESSSEIDGELTILVDEDGEMVLDITQTLSNFVDQTQEGSLVIITTDESSSQLDNTTITCNVSQENACENSFQLQTTSDFNDNSHPSIPQVPTVVSDLNKVNTPLILVVKVVMVFFLLKSSIFLYRTKHNFFFPAIC